jgi:hypothetical protein
MSARLAVGAQREHLTALPETYEDVSDGVGLGVPPTGVPPDPLAPVSPSESVGVAVGLPVPLSVGVGDVSVGDAVGDVSVGVGVGDVSVGVGVGDVGLTDGVTETLGEGVGLTVTDGVAAHDGDGVGDAGTDGATSAVFATAGVTEAAASDAFVWTSSLDQSTARVGGQLADAAGLAVAPPTGLVGPPRPGGAP